MHRTRILGTLVGAALALSLPATAVATEPVGISANPVKTCLRQANAELKGTGVQLRRADFDNVQLGTGGSDNFDGLTTLGRDLLCGFGGSDTLGTTGAYVLHGGDVFVGGGGNDYAEEVDRGIFIGGYGHDTVDLLRRNGLFVGGAGRDFVFNASSSRFYGRDGNDTVDRLLDAKFVGGAGGDRVLTGFDHGSRFLGGPGADRVVHEITKGRFIGGKGRDYVATVGLQARFAGGDGNDRVGRVRGVFQGGRGRDRARIVEGFMYGGAGDDIACELDPGGTFYGGPGSDTVGVATGGRAHAIENIAPCA